MDITPRLETLNRRRADIDAALHDEESHAYYNAALIHDLKVKKLHLKEEMYRLETAANNNRQRTTH
jgi:hypothetical protein